MAVTQPSKTINIPKVLGAAEHLAAMRLQELPEMLTAREVMDRLRISRQAVHRLIEGGELSAIRLGKRGVRIFRSSLIDYAERRLVD